MAAAIAAFPLRPRSPTEDSQRLQLGYTAPITTGDLAGHLAAQRGCPLIATLSSDEVGRVLAAITKDKRGGSTVPGLAALVCASKTCHYLRSLSQGVRTPFDVDVVERSEASIAGDANVNQQRFTLYALKRKTPDGFHPPTSVHKFDNAELVVYRDAREPFDRPVVACLAKRQPDDSLLCIELSIKELLSSLGGHSTSSLVRTDGLLGKRSAEVSVWGTSVGILALVDEQELDQDSLNPITLLRDDAQRVSIVVPPSTCAAFDEGKFTCGDASRLMQDLGYHDDPRVAWVPSASGTMIAPAQRLWKPPRRSKKRTNEDTGKISERNILSSGTRRRAVRACDLKIQRQSVEDALVVDGQFLPGHPEFDRIQRELDELNERLEAEGSAVRYTDPRLAPSSPKNGCIRDVLALK